MKCYSALLILTLSLPCFCAVYKITPAGKSDISPGDKIKAVMESAVPGGSLPDVRGKRIGGFFYVMEQSGSELEVIVAPPSSVDNAVMSPVGESKDKFLLEGFNYKHKNVENIKDYLVERPDYKLPWDGKVFLAVLALAALFASSPIYRRIQTSLERKRERKRLRVEAEEILRKLKEASSREEMENLFINREKCRQLVEAGDSFNSFLNALDRIQYKPSWTQDETEEVCRLLNKVKKTARMRSGI